MVHYMYIKRQPVTPEEAQNKIKSLIRSYKGLAGIATLPYKPGHRICDLIRKLIESSTIRARTQASLRKLNQNNDHLAPLFSVKELIGEGPELLTYENSQEQYKEPKKETILADPPEQKLGQTFDDNKQISKEIKREKNIKINKISEKKMLIEYKENRKDKRLKMRLDFLRYRGEYKRKFYDDKRRFYSESIDILREIKDIVQIASVKDGKIIP